MNINIEDLRKKIIYRSNYRGTKEMDTLLSSFVKKIINDLNESDLSDLSKLLDIDDDSLYKFNQGLLTTIPIEDNKINKLFKNFKYKNK